MYSLYADRERNLLIAEFSGFLSMDDAKAYIAEHDAEVGTNFPRGEYRMLFDISRCQLQSQPVLQMLCEWGANPSNRGTTAVVTGSSLAKMQAKRVADTRRTRIFQTVEAAESWLFAADQDRSAA